MSPNEFWDNITIPYSAYFPAPHHQRLTRSPNPSTSINLPAGVRGSLSLGSTHRLLTVDTQACMSHRGTHCQFFHCRPLLFQEWLLAEHCTAVLRHIDPTPHGQALGNDSPEGSESSHSLHQSYSCPLSHDMDISPATRAAQTPFMSPPILQHHSLTPPLMESQNPLSCQSHQMTPILPAMTLSDAI